MTPEQLDIDIEELSTRMERVRSLYEQYFMGIERLQPTIPRKDVERRIQVLRKTRFQNTAKRFKFQTLVQRYNSLQQYWNRTCRDIENGTYKRHVQRAERRFGVTGDADQTLGKNATQREDATAESDEADPAKKAAAAREQAGNDLASLLDSNTDLDTAMSNVLAELEKKPARTEPVATAEKPNDTTGRTTNTGLLGRLGKSEEGRETGLRTKTSPRPTGLQGLPPLKPVAKSSTGKSVPPRPTPRAERGAQIIPQQPANPRLPSRPPQRPARPLTSPGVAGLPPIKPPAAPLIKPPAAPPLKPPAAPPLKPPAAPPLKPPAAPPLKPPTAAGAPAPPRRAVAQPSGGQLSENRIKALHQSYVDARKQTNASSVSLEKLAKSLRDTEQKLRQKHRGRDIDFDVSIKDGKAILKPKLK